MAPRLLSLLTQVEGALINNGAPVGAAPAQRSVNFAKGTASMQFSNGSGAISLQNYSLADGQLCVRAVFSWGGTTTQGTHSIYPREGFDWAGAAEQIALAWMAGRTSAVTATTPASAVMPEERVAAEAAG